ncbi:MAG: bifunctional adenosylcobinamide kinase/adenosylcobinamide-phosphate guanylyltransferase [Lachnospiraceae bacterium]
MIFIIGGAYQGKLTYAQQHFAEEYVIMNQYQLVVKEALKKGLNPLEEAKRLLEQQDKLVIISDEMGCGIVPTDIFERQYREASGRVNCYLAGQAEQVIRVICGIGSRIA